jgi:hypothetical protein
MNTRDITGEHTRSGLSAFWKSAFCLTSSFGKSDAITNVEPP